MRKKVNDLRYQQTLFEENFLKREYKTLTTNPEVALTELVANAWDAGASKVNITIPSKVGQKIVVSDDGTGLTWEEFSQRWLMLRYNRLVRQGKKVKFPEGVDGKRLAFGRNGIGRHALLCFNEYYSVESVKDGIRFVVDIDSIPENPIHIRNRTTNEVDRALHGITVSTVVHERLPNPEEILNVLSSRFVSDPSFVIFVNNKKVETEKLEGLLSKSKKIKVSKGISIEILFFDTTASHRKSIYQGIAFWQANRLVGEPSWTLGGISILDGRTTNARKCIFVVKSDDLEDFVKEDWTGFRECAEMDLVYAKVREYVLDALAKYNKDNMEDFKSEVRNAYKDRLKQMSALGRYEVDQTIEHVVTSRPTATKEMIEVAVDAVVNVSQARKGDELLCKLAKLDPDQVDALNELLSTWDVRDALVVLEEIDRRISVVEAIRKLSSDKKTNELHTLHPLVTEARWIFGPEFESPEYTSNQQLQTIAKKIFHSDKGRFVNKKKRPDLFVVADHVYSITGLDELIDGSVSDLKRILIIELKRGGFDIKRGERDQAQHYVEDILQSGLVSQTVPILAYVVGDTIDRSVPREVIVGDNRNGIIRPVTFSQLVDTANRRLFKLRETLRCRYEDVPGIDLAQRVCQPDLPAETKAI